MSATYKKQRSVATITFTDGEVQTYEVSAGSTIAGYLMREASQTGILTLRDDSARSAVCIPLDRIRAVQFTPVTEKEENA